MVVSCTFFVLARRVWCPRDWHCCRCMRRTHAASWFFQSRVALSTSVRALRSLAVRSQSRTTSSLHVGVARRLRQLVLAHRVCSCQNTNQTSATVKTRKKCRLSRKKVRPTALPRPSHVLNCAAVLCRAMLHSSPRYRSHS